MIGYPRKRPFEQSHRSFSHIDLVNSIHHMLVIKCLLTPLRCPLNLHSQFGHVQRISKYTGKWPSSHRTTHRLKEWNVNFFTQLFTFISLLVDLLEVSIYIIIYQPTFKCFIEHKVKPRKGTEWSYCSPVSSVQPPYTFMVPNLLKCIVITAILISFKVDLNLSSLLDDVYRYK